MVAIGRAEYRCAACGAAGRLEVHHRQPLDAGGDPYDQDNLEVLCRSCHILAGGHVPVKGRREWTERLKRAIQ